MKNLAGHRHRHNILLFHLVFLLLLLATKAFVPVSLYASNRHPTLHKANVPDEISLMSSTANLLSFNGDQLSEMGKTLAIVAVLGGGLIPPTLIANGQMLKTMKGERAGGDNKDAIKIRSSSDTVGPALKNSQLLFANDDIKLVDIVAIIGRISSTEGIADWRNLPSAKRDNLVDPENPPMWLPRGMFKDNIRKAKFISWPTDPLTNAPVGGVELEKQALKLISSSNYAIPDAALDAVFDTWAWGSGIATPDKVAIQLSSWRKDRTLFDVDKFASAAVAGRSVTGAAIVTFILIQLIAYGVLFIAPALRVFFDLDIGLGVIGECPSGQCTRLF